MIYLICQTNLIIRKRRFIDGVYFVFRFVLMNSAKTQIPRTEREYASFSVKFVWRQSEFVVFRTATAVAVFLF